jgi:hypothetical protein|tara:strand:+ start:7610 stop:7729 length:120 start_codon:yes stop_codon:yes gene_type:complete
MNETKIFKEKYDIPFSTYLGAMVLVLVAIYVISGFLGGL